MTVKLTDAELVMTSAAAQREDRCLAAPERLKGAAVSKVSAKLVKLGLARQIRAKPGMPIWRHDEERRAYALKLTSTGLKGIAVDEGSQEAIGVGRQTHAVAPRDGSKLALVIDLLRRADGAGIVDLTGYGMAAAHDAGRAHRTAQTRVCRGARTGRRRRLGLPDLARRC